MSKCLRIALSGTTAGDTRSTTHGNGTGKPLGIEQLTGVFMLAIFCLGAALVLHISEWVTMATDQVKRDAGITTLYAHLKTYLHAHRDNQLIQVKLFSG